MSTCIFLGPTLSQADAQAIFPQCHILPPVQHGSIIQALNQWPLSAIGVIDGYFQHRPSVWHKEILWALDQGVYVAGAASMGALRAAELASFGMVGIGDVFRAFQQGSMPPFAGLCDDDEVAVVHGPAESGYIAVSDAMVNIRRTLDAACVAGVLDMQTAELLVTEAKSLHFSERKYSTIMEKARQLGVPVDVLHALARWLPEGKVDQKRADAVELVTHLANLQPEDRINTDARFHFEMTEIFNDALYSVPTATEQNSQTSERDQQILDELRLQPANYHSAKLLAVVQCVLLEEPLILTMLEQTLPGQSLSIPVSQTVDTFRRTRGLFDRDAIDRWLRDNDLSLSEFEGLMENKARVDALIALPDVPPVSMAVINHLRLNADYVLLASRAQRKSDLLDCLGDCTRPAQELIHWYFEMRCAAAIPADTTAYARSIGLPDESDLLRLLSREYQYLTHVDD